MIIGTVVNSTAIVMGGTLGILIARVGAGTERRANTIDAVIKMMGLAIVVLGLQMSLLEKHAYLPVVICLVVGTLIGELVGIEKAIERFGIFLKKLTRSSSDTFVSGFVSASVLFCVGATAILGSLREGLMNDPQLLYIKSLMDGIMAVIFAGSMGVGVLFSAIPIFIYQGILTLGASQLGFIQENPVIISGISVTGGIIVAGIGLNLLGVTKLRISNTLPAIFLTPIYDAVALYIAG